MLSIMKIALPALAAASTVYAECTVTGTTTVQNAGDATALASCSTFSGSIAVATGTTDDIALSGIQVMNGNLVANTVDNMKRISASDMVELNGEMNLNQVQRLYAVDFPKLKKVKSINFVALPNLMTIGFTASVEQADTVTVINTAVRSLAGINLQKAKKLEITNNPYINEIDMQLGNVSDSLTFADNNKGVKVALPNLLWATNLTFRSCGSVSVPSLAKLNGSLGLYTNGFESFSAPNLTEVGEALAIVGNDAMNNLTFPLLTKISDNLQIANNSALTEVDGFPLLKSIGGAFDISGNMSKVETPKLENVAGAFNLQSTDNVTEACNFYKSLQSKKWIRGSYVCKGKLVDPGTEGHNPTAQTGAKTGAASTLSAMNGALGLAAMAAVFLL